MFQKLFCKQRIKPTGPIQCRKIVESADVCSVDVDLWYGAATGLIHHFIAFSGVEIDANFVDILHALGFQ